MNLADIEHKCKEIDTVRKQLETKQIELQRLESEDKKKTQQAQILERLAKLRGDKYEGEHESEELMKTKKDAEDYQKRIKILEREVFKDLMDVTFPIPAEVPKINSERRSVINFEGTPCNHTIKFIASILNSNVPFELDKTELHPDKIIVTNVEKPMQVVERLEALHNNVVRLARIALGERDPDVESVVDYLYGSNYREVWEAVKGRKKITYEDLNSELEAKTPKDQKKIRNFFTNIEQILGGKFPFIRESPGVYGLSFLGSLVWKRYRDKYPEVKEIPKKPHREVSVGDVIEEEEKPGPSTLNKYLSNNEIKEVIYGKEVS